MNELIDTNHNVWKRLLAVLGNRNIIFSSTAI